MKITDSLSFLYNRSLYTSKKAEATNQSQFTQNINSNLSGNSVSGSVPNFTLYKDAIISQVNMMSGVSTHVYYAEGNDMYKVRGNDADGTEYETLIDVTKIDPNNASRAEMAAIAAHLGKQDDKLPVSFMLYGRREMDRYCSLSSNEQKNFKWKSVFAKENQYDDLNYIAQGFYKAGAMDGYVKVNNLIQNIMSQVKKFSVSI